MYSHILIVDNDKLTEVKTLLDSVASQLKGLQLLSVYSFMYVRNIQYIAFTFIIM